MGFQLAWTSAIITLLTNEPLITSFKVSSKFFSHLPALPKTDAPDLIAGIHSPQAGSASGWTQSNTAF